MQKMPFACWKGVNTVSKDYITAAFPSRSENEGLARVLVSAFIARLDPTLEELDDVRTAVSEAVTNAIIHGYSNEEGTVDLYCELNNRTLSLTIEDHGVGIDDVAMAMRPLYTSKPEEERSGMGFTMMQTFMDELSVDSEPGRGTKVVMRKSFRSPDDSGNTDITPESPAGRSDQP